MHLSEFALCTGDSLDLFRIVQVSFIRYAKRQYRCGIINLSDSKNGWPTSAKQNIAAERPQRYPRIHPADVCFNLPTVQASQGLGTLLQAILLRACERSPLGVGVLSGPWRQGWKRRCPWRPARTMIVSSHALNSHSISRFFAP